MTEQAIEIVERMGNPNEDLFLLSSGVSSVCYQASCTYAYLGTICLLCRCLAFPTINTNAEILEQKAHCTKKMLTNDLNDLNEKNVFAVNREGYFYTTMLLAKRSVEGRRKIVLP